MKRAFPHKVNPVSSNAVDKEELPKSSTYRVGLFRQGFPEGNPRARTSAAMIGLAISMGASSLFIPRQGDGAMAAEPMTAEPTAPAALTTQERGSFEPSAPGEAAAAAIGQKPSVQQHQAVQEEPTQWQPFQTDQIGEGAIAPSSDLKYQSVLENQAERYAPFDSSNVPNVETIAPWAERYRNQDREAASNEQLESKAAVGAFALNDGGIASDALPELKATQEVVQAKQEIATKKLKPLSDRFKNGRAEFGVEESTSSVTSVTEPLEEANAAEKPSTNSGNLSAGGARDGIETLQTAPEAISIPNWANWGGSAGDRSPAISPEEVEIPDASPRVLAPEKEGLQTRVGRSGITLERLEAPVIAPQEPSAPTAAPARINELGQSTLPAEQVETQAAPTVVPVPALAPDRVTSPQRSSITPEQEPIPTAPALVPTKEKTATSQTTEAPAIRTEISEEVVTPDLSQAVTIAPYANQPAIAKIYKVNPGDTVSEIAHNFGVSSSELIKANKLNDPNAIEIDRTLTIPLYQPGRQEVQTTALIHRPNNYGIGLTPNLQAKQSTQEMPVPNLVLPQPTSTASTMPISLGSGETSPDSNSSVALALAAQSNSSPRQAAETVQYTQPTANVPASLQSPAIQPATEENASSDGLRAEILKLREKYRAQKAGTVASNPSLVTNAPVVSAIDEQGQLSVPARPVNSQIQNAPQQQAELLQPESATVARARENTASQPLDQLPDSSPVMATAPLGSENYEPLQPRMVSPDLPPLAAPDTYLPKGSATFNGFIWPAQGELTSGYGWRWGRMHKGIDIAAPIGTPIVAAAPGKVTYAQWNEGGYGNLVEITHPDGSVTLYAHNDRILVREGQEVEQGQQVAEMGSTGFSTGPHLHFEIHPSGQGAVNPVAYLPQG